MRAIFSDHTFFLLFNMRQFLGGLLLLLLVGFVATSHAVPSSAGVTIIMGPRDLNQAAIESFLRASMGLV